MEVPQKRKEVDIFEFEPQAQASSFSSWKVSVRSEVTTGSTHFLLSSEWLAEADLAFTVDELDYSGFIVDKHQLEFETLDSEIAKGTMKIISADFQRKNNVLEETQYKKKRPLHTDRQIMFQVFSSTLMRLRSTRWSWVTCLLSSCTTTVSWCSIRLGTKHYQLFDNDLDKHVLETCMSGDWKRFTLMKHTVTFIRKTLFWKGSREDAKDWGPWSMTSSNSNSRTCWFLKTSDQETAAYSSKGSEEEGRDCRFWDVKNVCAPKEENLHSNMTRQRKEKAKGIGQGARSTVTIQQNDNMPESQGTVRLEKNRPPCFNCKIGNSGHDRECDYWHPPHPDQTVCGLKLGQNDPRNK